MQLTRFSAGVLVGMLGMTAVQASVPAPYSGPDLISRCRRAYGALASYEGKTLVRDTVPRSVEERAKEAKRGGKRLSPYRVSRSSATIWFRKPDHIRVTGTLSAEAGEKPGAFFIVADGKTTWTSWSTEGNKWEVAQDPGMAVAGFTGVSGGACTTIPALLLDTDWGDPFAGLENVSAHAQIDTVGGKTAYRVTGRSATGADTTFWIDAHTLLLLQMRERTNWDETMRRLRRDVKARGGHVNLGPEMHWKAPYLYSETVETFTDVKANQPLPDSLFARPASAPEKASES